MEICMLCSRGCHGTRFYSAQSVLLARRRLPPAAQINKTVWSVHVYHLPKWTIRTAMEEEEDVGEAESERGVIQRRSIIWWLKNNPEVDGSAESNAEGREAAMCRVSLQLQIGRKILFIIQSCCFDHKTMQPVSVLKLTSVKNGKPSLCVGVYKKRCREPAEETHQQIEM